MVNLKAIVSNRTSTHRSRCRIEAARAQEASFNHHEKNQTINSLIATKKPSLRDETHYIVHSATIHTKNTRRESLFIGMTALSTTLFFSLPVHAKKKSSSGGDWSSPGLSSPDDDVAPKFFKTSSGVAVQQLLEGSGDATVKRGDRVLLDYVLRRSNGYFIYGTVEGVSFQPKDVPTGAVALTLNNDVIPGLVDGIEGMKQGGKRRILVPPRIGYTNENAGLEPKMPTFATKRQLENHSNEPLLFELELIRIIQRG